LLANRRSYIWRCGFKKRLISSPNPPWKWDKIKTSHQQESLFGPTLSRTSVAHIRCWFSLNSPVTSRIVIKSFLFNHSHNEIMPLVDCCVHWLKETKNKQETPWSISYFSKHCVKSILEKVVSAWCRPATESASSLLTDIVCWQKAAAKIHRCKKKGKLVADSLSPIRCVQKKIKVNAFPAGVYKLTIIRG